MESLEKLEQRVCLRCRSIFMGHPGETACPTCNKNLQKEDFIKEKVRRQTAAPPNPWIECLIERDGNPQVFLGGVAYTFRPNEAGHSVCQIKNPRHHSHFLKRPSLYQLYEE